MAAAVDCEIEVERLAQSVAAAVEIRPSGRWVTTLGIPLVGSP